MNQYGSIVRRFWASSVHEAALTTGTDVTIPGDADTHTLLAMVRDASHLPVIGKHTNMIIRSAGVFSNFAGGLVFKEPAQRISLGISAVALIGTGDTGAVTLTQDSKTVPGVNAIAGVGDGSVMKFSDPALTVNQRNPTAYIDIVGEAATNTMRKYAPWSTSGGGTTAERMSLALAAGSVPQVFAIELPVLNCMVPINEFMSPTDFGVAATTDDIAFFVNPMQAPFGGSVLRPTTFLTDAISNAFDGQTVFFDIAVDIEFTGTES